MIRRKLLLQIMGFTLVLLLQLRCSAAQIQPDATLEPSATPVSYQKFTIISTYEGLTAYVEAARAASNIGLNALFRQYVVAPYWEDCADGTENMNREKDSITPIKDMDYLTSAVAIPRDSNVEQMVEEALQKSAKVLSGPNTTVCIIVADPQSTFVRDYMNGVSGSTVRAGKIWLEIYPNGDWRDWIPYTLAHEYHHSVWMDRQGRQSKLSDMVDYLVSEGRADSFARLVYPNVAAPWTEALTPEQEMTQWRAMQQSLDARAPATHRKFMFGGSDVPRWTGYTIGFHIVQSYLQKNPQVPVDEWTTMDAHELLDESGYNAKR